MKVTAIIGSAIAAVGLCSLWIKFHHTGSEPNPYTDRNARPDFIAHSHAAPTAGGDRTD